MLDDSHLQRPLGGRQFFQGVHQTLGNLVGGRKLVSAGVPGDTSAACNNKTGQPSANVNTRLIARACVNCHNAIHCSNAPAARGKFFTR